MNNNKHQIMAVVMSGLMAMAVSGWAVPPYGDPNQPYDKIPGTWETEHVKWAKPLAGGKLKVLFIVPYITCREVVEVAQRLDVDYTVIMTAGIANWDECGFVWPNQTRLYGLEATAVMERVSKQRLNLANEYDAIVIGNVSWLTMPAKVKELILKHVERGTGLVYVSPGRIEKEKLKIADGEDPEFTALFRKNENPALARQVFESFPMDCLPLKILAEVDEFKALKPVRANNWGQLNRIQNPVCITVSHQGKGRVFGVHYFAAEFNQLRDFLPCLTPDVDYVPVTYDYLCALLAKCVLLSAGRESAVKPGIEIQAPATDLKAPKAEEKILQCCWEEKTPARVVARKDLGEAKLVLSVELTNGPAKTIILDYHVRNEKGDSLVQDSCQVGLQSGKKETREIKLPKLGRGTYFVGLRVLDQDKLVMDFSSKSFRVEDPLKVQKIELDKEAYQPGEVMKGKVSFSQALTGEQRVEVVAVDIWKRVVAKGEVKLAEGRTGGEFTLPVELPLCRLWDVVCEIKDKEGVIDAGKTWVGIPDWNFNEFAWGLFLSPAPFHDFRGHCLVRAMKRFGMNADGTDLIYGMTEEFESNERYGLLNLHYAEHLGQSSGCPPGDLNKEFSGRCLSEFSRMARYIADTGKFPDPKEFPYNSNQEWGWMDAKWFHTGVEGRYRASAKVGSPLYIIAGENQLTGEIQSQENSCFCPLCTRLFQEWSKKTYGNDIKKLNEEWGSDFKNFDEVRGILIKEAVDKNQLPRWVDFRYFMRSQVFTQFAIDWTDMIRRYAPQARTADWIFCNFDYTRLRNHVTGGSIGASDLGSIKAELHQSFSGDKSYMLGDNNTLGWDQEFRTPMDNARFPWKHLFLGYQGLKLGMESWGASMGGENYLTADYSEPLPFFKHISDELLLLNRGIGTFVLTAKPMRSKVAILWSPYNHYISRLFPLQDNGFSGGAGANVRADGGAIEDCYMLMQSLMIRPTFIGPQDVEGGELEKQGYRALMLPYSKGVSVAEAEAIKKFVKAGGVVIADNEPGIYSEHGRVLKEGRLKELFPVMDRKNIQQYGKGIAAYLPGEINGYTARLIRCDYTGSDSVAIVLKEHAGIQPPIELINSKGLSRRDTLTGVFSQGATLIVGLLRELESQGKETSPTTMIFQQPYHVWDVREKRYCGYVNRLQIDLTLYPRCYALLPSNPGKIKLESDKSAVKQGEVVTVKGEVNFEGDKEVDSMGQVVHVEVIGPELQEKGCYTRNVIFKGRSFQIKVPVSYSEKPGRYTVVAEHAITGMKAEICFDVAE